MKSIAAVPAIAAVALACATPASALVAPVTVSGTLARATGPAQVGDLYAMTFSYNDQAEPSCSAITFTCDYFPPQGGATFAITRDGVRVFSGSTLFVRPIYAFDTQALLFTGPNDPTTQRFQLGYPRELGPALPSHAWLDGRAVQFSFTGLEFAGLDPSGNPFFTAVSGGGDGMISTVPEPAGWVLMIGGCGIAGGVMRRRATRARFA